MLIILFFPPSISENTDIFDGCLYADLNTHHLAMVSHVERPNTYLLAVGVSCIHIGNAPHRIDAGVRVNPSAIRHICTQDRLFS